MIRKGFTPPIRSAPRQGPAQARDGRGLMGAGTAKVAILVATVHCRGSAVAQRLQYGTDFRPQPWVPEIRRWSRA